jgi:hypothetical protein
MNWLTEGTRPNKTSILAVLGGLTAFAQAMHWITPEQSGQILAFIGSLAALTMRAAVQKAQETAAKPEAEKKADARAEGK